MTVTEEFRRRFENLKAGHLSDMRKRHFEERALCLKELDRDIDILGYDLAKKLYDRRIWEAEQKYLKAELRFNPNHGKDGKFTSGNGLTSGGKGVKIDSKGVPYKYPELRLPKKEYGKVIHEIDTNFHGRYEGQKYGLIDVANSRYKFEIHEFNEYNIVEKEKIK